MGRELPAKVRLGVLDGLSKTLDKVKAKFPDMSRAVSRTNTAFQILEKSSEGARKTLNKIGDSMGKVGKFATVGITAPVVAASALSVKKFSEIEDALVELKGSANLSSLEVTDFAERISRASQKITVPQEELLKLAGIAGDVGVRGVDNLEKFTLTLAKMQKITGISGEESADTIKKMLELSGEGVQNIDRFASALAATGDKYGVSAKKIIESTFEISREISKFGVSSSQVVGLAAAVEPLGFNAKQASGAVGDAFRAIDVSIREGGQKLKGLSAITGMTGDEIKKQFSQDATVVFRRFLDGLNKIKENGGPTGKALEFFGASGEKTQIILEALGKNTGKLTEEMAFAKSEYAANTALSEKYEEATGTLSSKMALLRNNVDILENKLGGKLAPSVGAFADLLSGFIKFLEAHPVLETMIAIFAGIAATIGPVLIGLAGLVKTIPAVISGWAAFKAVMAGFGITTWAATLPLIILIAKIALITSAIVGFIALIWVYRDAIKKGFVSALDYVIERFNIFIEMVSNAVATVKEFFGLGSKNLEVGANANFGPQPLLPQGQPIGGLEAKQIVNPEFAMQTNNARVDINVRAPQSTSVVSEQQGSFLNINRGLAGAF